MQDPGLEAWGSFSEVAEEESDASFSLAGREAGKRAFELDVLNVSHPKGHFATWKDQLAGTKLLLLPPGAKKLQEAPTPGLSSASSLR